MATNQHIYRRKVTTYYIYYIVQIQKSSHLPLELIKNIITMLVIPLQQSCQQWSHI